MKVLFVSSSSGSRGGGELYLLSLAEALVKLEAEVGLWCTTHSRMDELANSFKEFGKVFRSPYTNTYDYKIRSFRYLLSGKITGLESAIKDFKPDVIHLNKQNIEDGLDLLKTLDQLGTPFVTTIHITQMQKSLGALLGGLRDQLSRRILRHSRTRKWIAISPARAQDLTNFLDNDKIITIPNGVEFNEFSKPHSNSELRKALNIPENNLVAITVGRLESQKDPMKFIHWAEQCLRIDTKVNFLWVGDGRLRSDFEKGVNDRHLNDHIKCLGWQKDVKPFYELANMYLHTARFEGLPFSLLEAMSYKLPCVVSDELYEDLSFPEKTLGRGLGALTLYLRNKKLMETKGLMGYEYVKKNFSIHEIAKTYLSVYKNIND